MSELENKYKEILDKVASVAIQMNILTAHAKGVEDQIKTIQMATSLAIIEPMFDYLDESDNKDLKETVKNYREALKMLKERGILTVIKDVKQYLKENEADEKNADNPGE